MIPIYGILTRTRSIFSLNGFGTALVEVSRQLRHALGDPSVRSIVLDVDSPGGEAGGITELHSEILSGTKKKPIVAQVSGYGASAAYHLISAASEIVASPSAEVGSVGVIGVHIESSRRLKQHGLGITLKTAGKFKGDASGLLPLSQDGGRELQRKVDHAYRLMLNDIARGRRLPVGQVRKEMGDARLIESTQALKLNMVDRIGTLGDTLKRTVLTRSELTALSGIAFRERIRVEAEADRYRRRMARAKRAG